MIADVAHGYLSGPHLWYVTLHYQRTVNHLNPYLPNASYAWTFQTALLDHGFSGHTAGNVQLCQLINQKDLLLLHYPCSLTCCSVSMRTLNTASFLYQSGLTSSQFIQRSPRSNLQKHRNWHLLPSVQQQPTYTIVTRKMSLRSAQGAATLN